MPQAKSLLAQIEQMRKAAGQSASEAAELNEQEGLLTSIKAAETEARGRFNAWAARMKLPISATRTKYSNCLRSMC